MDTTKLYTQTGIAELINRTQQLINNFKNAGLIEQPAVKIGKREFWTQEQVDRFLQVYKPKKLRAKGEQ